MRKTAKKSGKWIYFLLIVLMPILVYLLSFSSVVYNKPFIEKQMEKSGLFFNAKDVNSYVIDYMAEKDEKNLIHLDVFDEREQQHLLDVKILIHRIFDALFLFGVLFFVLLYHNHKISKSVNLGKIFIYSGMITAAIPLILYFMPFEFLFSNMHKLFFEAGSWIFSPNSALVQIYPASFWHNVSKSIFLRGFVTGWLLIILGFVVSKK